MLKRMGLAAAVAALFATPVLANDSSAEMGTGGLELVRVDSVSIVSEDLFISADEVRVDYVFENITDADVDTLVAFPMPDIDAHPYEELSIPAPNDDNYMQFSVSVDGRPVEVSLEQRATAFGVDITRELQKLGVPLLPRSEAAYNALEELDTGTLEDFDARGIIILDSYDIGDGWETYAQPTWHLSSTYWWRMVFPAGEQVRVSHRYAPAVGGTAGIMGIDYQTGRFTPDYVEKYCIDDSYQRAVDRRITEQADSYGVMWERRISYILMTANNWYGPIERFHLTVDKGDEGALVSFCADGVTKTGPTTFEVTYTDYVPERDLDILLLSPVN